MASELTDGILIGQDAERQRIAQELHDDISQRLALVGFELNDAQRMARVAKAPEVEQKLRTIQQTIGSIASDLHRISYNLHPLALVHLGLVGGLRKLCEEFSAGRRLGVEFTSGVASSHASPAVALSLYRVTQECLANVAKHSGSARAQVTFTEHPEALHLTIADDGVGFDLDQLPSTGLGFISVRERVRRVGGDVEIASAPRRGVTVTVRVPLALAQAVDRTTSHAAARVSGDAD